MSKLRKARLKGLIKRELSDIFLKEISDPRIGFININDVELSPDLRYAKVFFGVIGDEKDKERTIEGLKSATKHIQALLGGRLKLRYVPFISFHYDETIERAVRLTEIIEELEKKNE